jgi:hypothetical protein
LECTCACCWHVYEKLIKNNLYRDCEQFHQYQQDKQRLASNNWTQKEHDVWFYAYTDPTNVLSIFMLSLIFVILYDHLPTHFTLLVSGQLTTSIHWFCYCTFHVYVIVKFCGSMCFLFERWKWICAEFHCLFIYVLVKCVGKWSYNITKMSDNIKIDSTLVGSVYAWSNVSIYWMNWRRNLIS